MSIINNSLPGSLDGLYGSISGLAPSAQVVVVGYPRIFMGEDCNAFTWFSPAEESRLNATADLLNGLLASVASAHGFGFANPTGAFIGHAVCDNPEWINGLSNPISDSYHPNQAGHGSGYAPVVGGVLGFAFAATPAVLQAARAQGSELAAQQRQYAGLDRTIEPDLFQAPDLRQPARPEGREGARDQPGALDRSAHLTVRTAGRPPLGRAVADRADPRLVSRVKRSPAAIDDLDKVDERSAGS